MTDGEKLKAITAAMIACEEQCTAVVELHNAESRRKGPHQLMGLCLSNRDWQMSRMKQMVKEIKVIIAAK